MIKGETILAPSSWKAILRSGRSSTGTIEIEWATGPLTGRHARISAVGCRVVSPLTKKRPRRKHRSRIIRRDGEVIG